MELIRIIWNFFAIIFAIGAIGVCIGAMVTGMWGFFWFYLIFGLFLFIFCQI